MRKKCQFKSNFASLIDKFILQKRVLGYKYEPEEQILRRFDAFCNDKYPTAVVIDEDIVTEWIRQPYVKTSTLETRLSPIRELVKFVQREGMHAYLPPKGILPKAQRYIPYIFSDEEVIRLFAAIDECHYHIEVPFRHLVMPLFFRTLYACGLRVSEARLLRVCDVNVDDGILTLVFTKNGRERLIPLSKSLHKAYKEYAVKVHQMSSPEDPFFPGYKGMPMTIGNVEKNFRRFLWKAGISHPGRTKEGERGAPCVHSWRHTFAVNCLRKWIREGKDVNAYLPVLQSYLGHADYEDTAYYLRFTPGLGKDINTLLEKTFSEVIPNYHDMQEKEGL